MPYVPFHEFFPDLAKRETRSVTTTATMMAAMTKTGPSGNMARLYGKGADSDQHTAISLHGLGLIAVR